MASCYHPEARFRDIAFDLQGIKRIHSMWHMICDTDIHATFEVIDATGRDGRVNVGSAFAAGLLQVVFAILSVIQWLVIIAAVISWVNPDPRNPIVQFLYRTTEPLLRLLLPPNRKRPRTTAAFLA